MSAPATAPPTPPPVDLDALGATIRIEVPRERYEAAQRSRKAFRDLVVSADDDEAYEAAARCYQLDRQHLADAILSAPVAPPAAAVTPRVPPNERESWRRGLGYAIALAAKFITRERTNEGRSALDDLHQALCRKRDKHAMEDATAELIASWEAPSAAAQGEEGGGAEDYRGLYGKLCDGIQAALGQHWTEAPVGSDIRDVVRGVVTALHTATDQLRKSWAEVNDLRQQLHAAREDNRVWLPRVAEIASLRAKRDAALAAGGRLAEVMKMDLDVSATDETNAGHALRSWDALAKGSEGQHG